MIKQFRATLTKRDVTVQDLREHLESAITHIEILGAENARLKAQLNSKKFKRKRDVEGGKSKGNFNYTQVITTTACYVIQLRRYHLGFGCCCVMFTHVQYYSESINCQECL